MAHPVTFAAYEQARAHDAGFCSDCLIFCGDYIEPDMSKAVCPECYEFTLYGAEEALLQGLITVSTGSDEAQGSLF